MLEQNGGREGIDIALAPPGRLAHRPDRTQGRRRGESFVHIADRQAGAARQLVADASRLDRARRLVAFGVEREPAARRASSAIGGRWPARRRMWPAGDAIVPVGSLTARPTRRSP
jgi:hypothetical protein